MKIYNYDSQNGLLLRGSKADESPLEVGVYLIPAYATTIEPPLPQIDKTIHFENGKWIYKDIPVIEEVKEPEPYVMTYADHRRAEYPPMSDYLDGVVKGDQTQIDKYITDCLSIKAKYPKPV